MSSLFRWLLLAIALASCMSASLATADDQPSGEPEKIVAQEPGFYVKADVDKKSREYREGDPLAISVVAEQEAYIYALYKQADGKVFQIFPNSGQPDNKIAAKTAITLPGRNDRFTWKVAGPFGKEVIKVIASKEPLENLSDPELRKKFFNTVTQQQVKDLAVKLDQAEAKTWTEDQVEIITHDKSWQPPPPPAKRIGVFFGVSHYEFNDLVKAASGNNPDAWELDLPACHTDALVLDRLFREQGKLDDAQVFVNEQATRAQMEQAITRWLPSVSKPGDTVLIFFSGHGAPIPPYKPGDAHVRGSFLLTHDFVADSAFVEMMKRQKAGTLSPQLSARFNTIMGWLKSGGRVSNDDQIRQILAYRSGVPDDVFGHWLQRLAGRQIIVILNACHSAGFAAEGKDLQAADPPAFDFLSPQLGRLKDLGQGETALLTACGSKETTLAFHVSDERLEELRRASKGIVEENVPEKLAVFTYYIAEELLTAPAPLRIESLHDYCRKEMATYVDRLNAVNRERKKEPIAPYTPRLFNHCSKPVLVKP